MADETIQFSIKNENDEEMKKYSSRFTTHLTKRGTIRSVR